MNGKTLRVRVVPPKAGLPFAIQNKLGKIIQLRGGRFPLRPVTRVIADLAANSLECRGFGHGSFPSFLMTLYAPN